MEHKYDMLAKYCGAMHGYKTRINTVCYDM